MDAAAQHSPVLRQASLFCTCGRAIPAKADRCVRCYQHQWYSRRYFGGHRDAVLLRDAGRCQVCDSRKHVVVHHRQPGRHEFHLLVAVCAVCHNRLHRLQAIRKLVPDRLIHLWREQHPNVPLQLQFPYGA